MSHISPKQPSCFSKNTVFENQDSWNLLWIKRFNSLASERCTCNLKLVTFKPIPRIDLLSISCEITLRWMPLDLANDRSALIQVRVWCLQAAGHYLSQLYMPSLGYSGLNDKPRHGYILDSHVFIYLLFATKINNINVWISLYQLFKLQKLSYSSIICSIGNSILFYSRSNALLYPDDFG